MSNKFKNQLLMKQQLKGAWLALANPISAEAMSYVGLDFLVLDLEHAPNDISTTILQLQAIENGSSAAIARIPENNPIWVKKVLDIGARNILVPMVNNREDALVAVKYSFYPPQGIRGVGTQHRACRYGLDKEYLTETASEIALIVQIETKQAAENLEEIAGVDGIDALFVGPSDLAASLGFLGNNMDPEVQNTLVQIAKRCTEMHKPIGILAPNVEIAKQYVKMGYTFVAVGSDLSFMLAGATQVLKNL